MRVSISDSVGEGLDGRAECGELVGDRGDRPIGRSLAVVLDDSAHSGVAVNRGPGDPACSAAAATVTGPPSRVSSAQAALDVVQRGAGHPVWVSVPAMSASRDDELAMAVDLVDPSSLFGVAGVSVGVDALRGKDRE